MTYFVPVRNVNVEHFRCAEAAIATSTSAEVALGLGLEPVNQERDTRRQEDWTANA